MDRRSRHLSSMCRPKSLWPTTTSNRGPGDPGQRQERSASDLDMALQTAQRTGWRVAEQLGPEGVDVILLPTRAQTTPKLGYLDVRDPETMGPRTSRLAVCTNMFNLSGQPAISLQRLGARVGLSGRRAAHGAFRPRPPRG